MRNPIQPFSKLMPYRLRHKQGGVALITTLLLLLLLTAMSVAMVLSTSSDMMINGYYKNFRGSFYAADSGLNIARQALLNGILAAVPQVFNANVQPIPPGTDANVQAAILANYGTAYQYLNLGQAATSYPGKFEITLAKLSPPTCTVIGGGGTCAAPTGTVTGYSYNYDYSLRSVGQAQGSEAATLDDRGTITINAALKTAGGTTTSFAAWGMFIDQYGICSGGYLVPGTITGPVFTNGAWTFGDSGKYIFTDSVGSVNPKAGYQYGSGACDQSAVTSDKNGNTTIAPTFQAGLGLGQPSVPLPLNAYSQERAVLDGVGTNNAQVTKSDLNSSLRNISKSPYPSAGASSGVFLPYTVDATTGAATFTGGGIFVEGDASVTLTPSGATAQIYKIVQGGVTTTVTVDTALNTTVVSDGSTSLTITGVPTQKDPSTGGVMRDATMLYVDGNISSLSGPGQGQAGIQDTTALTITAARSVTVTGDILYKTEPVTTTQNQIVPGTSPACCNGTPADTLIPGSNKGQVLGIFTATGDVQLANGQSNGTLEIDASVATLSQGGSGGIVNTGSRINTLTIVGGRIQNQIKNINTTTRNVFFDRRFQQNGFAPPWFPSTIVGAGGKDSATLTSSVSRLQWVDQSAY